MTTCTYNCLMNVINIGNSIIGVSILAMPYCFRKCGILLSVVLIFISGMLTRLACYLLLKSAIMARRRNFEFLAFHTFGTTGKLAVEISVIGFLIGVCIAFFVVIGDLGPPLAAEFLMINNSSHLRTNVLMLIGLCVALPLGMLRKIDSLTSLSALSIAFYGCLIVKIFAEAVPNLAANEWWHQVNWWQTDGILPCLPIFSMALSCQTQIFEFFDTLNDPSLKRMQSAINGAVYLCSTVYMSVGILGYIAFHNKLITGNILVLLTPSVITEVIKLGFIITIAISFPLCLFPCRSSLHSLLFKQGFGHHDLPVTVIPEMRFRILTVSLVIVTIGIAIMLPNIEFVLGIIGSTIGTLICLIFPAMMFIHDSSKNTTEKRMAQVLMGIGSFILIACTYSTLQEASVRPDPVAKQIQTIMNHTPQPVLDLSASSVAAEEIISPVIILKPEISDLNRENKEKPPDEQVPLEQKRLEPPIPQEPESKINVGHENHLKVEPNADLDPQALQNEDKEIQKESVINSPAPNIVEVLKKDKTIEKQEKLLQKLEEQHEEQKIILQEQKKVLEELKLHKESHDEKRKSDLDTVKVNAVAEKEIQLGQLKNNHEPIVEIYPKISDLNVVSQTLSASNINPSHAPYRNSDNILNASHPLLIEKNLNNKPDSQKAQSLNTPTDTKVSNVNRNIKTTLNDTPIINKAGVQAVIQNASTPLRIRLPLLNKIPESVKKEPIENNIQNDQNNLDAHINRREPLAKKPDSQDFSMLLTKKDININAVLLGEQKLPT